jgi:hypothetical protein
MNDVTPWLMLALLGAYHGLNPGMGWLFAVALGLQERRWKAVVRAIGPIAGGHALSIAVVVAAVAVAGTAISTDLLRVAGGVALLGFGLYKLLAPFSHPRWVGMRVSSRDLVAWSWLMATAHGAGLMLIPVLLQDADVASAHSAHASHAGHSPPDGGSSLPLTEVASVLVHTAAMFVVMGGIALIVYQWLGVKILRRGWFNVDRVWALMLLLAGGWTIAG